MMTVTISSQPYIFDRRRHSHPWETELSHLLGRQEPGVSALAANWRMDSRVDRDREKELDGSGCFPSAANSVEFGKAISDYFSYNQCRPAGGVPEPGYIGQDNRFNLIPAVDRPSRNHHLLHIASINGLLKFILRSGNPGRTDFQIELARITGLRPLNSVNLAEVDQLADNLNNGPPDKIKQFARLASDILGPNEPLWWAAFAHEVGDFTISDDWTATAQVLGLGHMEVGHRLLAWRYSPSIVGQLFRPTVAEARNSGFHFPSPPGSAYGVTMPLHSGVVAVKELVHPPLKGDDSYDFCIERIGRVETDPVPLSDPSQLYNWFGSRRREHRDYIARQYVHPNVTNWLLRHEMLP